MFVLYCINNGYENIVLLWVSFIFFFYFFLGLFQHLLSFTATAPIRLSKLLFVSFSNKRISYATHRWMYQLIKNTFNTALIFIIYGIFPFSFFNLRLIWFFDFCCFIVCISKCKSFFHFYGNLIYFFLIVLKANKMKFCLFVDIVMGNNIKNLRTRRF